MQRCERRRAIESLDIHHELNGLAAHRQPIHPRAGEGDRAFGVADALPRTRAQDDTVGVDDVHDVDVADGDGRCREGHSVALDARHFGNRLGEPHDAIVEVLHALRERTATLRQDHRGLRGNLMIVCPALDGERRSVEEMPRLLSTKRE